jgi:Cu(I)/Ag(I) efflux system membrane fusion protein
MKITYKIGIIILILLLISAGIYFFYQPTETTELTQNMGDTYVTGNYQVQIKLIPEKPRTGKNQLTFFIRDPKDQPVTDAIIEAYAEMPAMGSMPAMREAINIENSGSGLYQGQYSLPMNGLWPLTISIESAKQGKSELLFDMSTSRPGLNLSQATPSDLSPQTAVKKQLTAFHVDSNRRQLIGVTTSEVICKNVVKNLTIGAKVTYNQSSLTDISLKYDAWIGQLNADFLGKQVHQGETLFTVYSPELVSAQDEYLYSIKQSHSNGLRKAARKKLALWDINPSQIQALAKRGRTSEYLSILSPVNGTIVKKTIVAGSAVKAGDSVLRLADLSSVWIEGEVYEADLPWIKDGMEVLITFPEIPQQTLTSKLSFISPVLNPQTRSAVIRVELANTNGLLKPDMFATMNLLIDLGERLIVPEQAVIYAGKQRIVFVDKGEGRLLPTRIKTGLRNENMIEVLEGLETGDIIVTSGNFLIAAESKLKSGLAQW